MKSDFYFCLCQSSRSWRLFMCLLKELKYVFKTRMFELKWNTHIQYLKLATWYQTSIFVLKHNKCFLCYCHRSAIYSTAVFTVRAVSCREWLFHEKTHRDKITYPCEKTARIPSLLWEIKVIKFEKKLFLKNVEIKILRKKRVENYL